MPSKGIECYGFVQGTNRKIVFSKPINDGDDTFFAPPVADGAEIELTKMQMDSADIGYNEKSGRYRCRAYEGTDMLFHVFAEIDPYTGNMDATDLGNFLACPSITNTESGYAISYGFYDASSGATLFYNQDQSYMYFTDDVSQWMGRLLKDHSELNDVPFSVFALPGAHDAGMLTDVNAARFLNSPQFDLLVVAITDVLGTLSPVLAIMAIAYKEIVAQNTINNLSITQKDTITTMLNLGVRYFDFRPGKVFKNVFPGIYHQHSFVPGYEYESFVSDVVTWLDGHPKEIVVVCLGNSGFASKPEMSVAFYDLKKTILSTILSAKSKLQVGDKTDFNNTIGNIIDTHRRLILITQLDTTKDDAIHNAPKYDSYNENLYSTTEAFNIITALNAMQTQPPPVSSNQTPMAYTVLQLQGTATGTKPGVAASLLDFSEATSPLMGTKAKFDAQTYPWLRENAGKFSPDYPLVFLNDFVDNALTVHAIKATQQRLEKYLNKTDKFTWQQLGDAKNPASIVTDGGSVYQLDSNGCIWMYPGESNTWKQLDNNADAKQIVCGGGNLFQLHHSGNIYQYNGTPMTGWTMLGNNPATVQIATDGINLYQLQQNGNILVYNGPTITDWQVLDTNPAAIKIAASAGQLYELHNTGRIWQYGGIPIDGWQLLFDYPTWDNPVPGDDARPVDIVADGNNLYRLQNKGGIYKYNSLLFSGWQMLDMESDVSQIAAANGQVFKVHTDGSVYQFIDTEFSQLTGWKTLDQNNGANIIATGNGSLFEAGNYVLQGRNNGTVLQYNHYKWKDDNAWDNWTKIGGPASSLASFGSNLCCLSLDGGTIYQYSPTEDNWTVIQTGGLRNILTSGGNTLYRTYELEGILATIATNNIYQYTGSGTQWDSIGGPGKMFVYAGNNLYGLSPNGQAVYKYGGTPDQWSQVGGSMVTLIGGGKNLYGVSSDGNNLLQYSGNDTQWTKIGGPAYMFAAVGDDVYGLVPNRTAIYKYSGTPDNWTQVGGNTLGIIGGGNVLYCISPDNLALWRYTNNQQWEQIGGPAYMYLPIGDDIYGISQNRDSIYKLNS